MESEVIYRCVSSLNTFKTAPRIKSLMKTKNGERKIRIEVSTGPVTDWLQVGD